MKNLAIALGIMAAATVLAGGVGLAADFDGDSRDDLAVFRPSSGLWAVRGVTRVYFGRSTDEPRPGDYSGDGIADIAVFRPSSGLWAVRGVTREYFGQSSDIPIQGGGGGERTYDYVVKPDDGNDLEDALESDTYTSVFIPAGTYIVNEVVTVDNVRRIVGAGVGNTTIQFLGDGYNLDVEEDYCSIEEITFQSGGNTSNGHGQVYVTADYVSIRNCHSNNSNEDGFEYSPGASYITIDGCLAANAAEDGFQGNVNNLSSRLSNCSASNCQSGGFRQCNNLAVCSVFGLGNTDIGFYGCERISSAYADRCDNYGFYGCNSVSAAKVEGGSGITDTGFSGCYRLSSCEETGSSTDYDNCNVSDDFGNKYSVN